ncbi:hypothetical protein J3F84DRAFT_400942 [Trichoderma pleuroticola]
MAPMGILTAIVSAIRVCGSPSLRAFIGRAQEGGGNTEAELCSSTSRNVCELYNNGGIERVFWRPKILEVVYDPEHSFADEKAGIYTFQEFRKSPGNNGIMPDTFAENFSPNLSLNVGIKRKPPAIFWTVAMIGMVLQAGVLVFAVLVTYYLRWEKDGSHSESYACPLTITGTLLLCGGIYLCAFLVGESTKEQIFRRNQDEGQVLGDQVFDAFCCSDHMEPLQEYITSWKSQSKISQIVVWVAVGISVTGFAMQFVGLRAIHSAVSVAQLGAIMLMSAARAALRMQLLEPEDNFLAQCPDEVVGHELDWLAVRIGERDFQHGRKPSSPRQDSQAYPRLLLKILELNVAAKLLAYRTRLAQLTQSQNTQTKGTNFAEHFDVRLVEVLETAHRLTLAVEFAINTIFSKSPKIRDKWRDALSMFWSFACDIASTEPSDNSEDQPIQHTIYLNLTRKELTTPWKLQNKLSLEGLLGLWVWSLKSDPAVEISDSQSHFTISRATEIPTQRIIPTNKSIDTDLKIWLGGEQDKEVRFFGWQATKTSQGPSSDPSSVISTHTDSSLLSQCAQEVFGSFISSILEILDDIGDIDIQETPSFRLENIFVTKMVKLFTETQLGSNEDALLCILPLMIPRLRLSSTENAHRRAGKWAQAETMLRWAGAVCDESQPHARKDDCQSDQPLHTDEPIRQAAISLGELYRIRWLSDQKLSHQVPHSLAVDEIIDRYHDIAERVFQQGNNARDSIPFSEIKDDLSEFTEVVLALLELGAEPDFRDPAQDSRTALSQAAESGSINTMKELIDWGAFPNAQDAKDRTPLSHEAVVKVLVHKGADVNAKDNEGRTPMMFAAMHEREVSVTLLAEEGADINVKTTQGVTPLMQAALHGRTAAVELLVQSGADLNARDKK